MVDDKLAKLTLASEPSYISLFIDLWQDTPHKLVTRHYSLIRTAAATYHQKTIIDDEAKFNDLLSVGMESLYKSARKYFLEPKGSFKALAWEALKKDFRSEQNQKHPVPAKIRKKLSLLKDVRDQIFAEGLVASRNELLKRLNLSEQQLSELLQVEAVWGTGADFETDVLIEDIGEPDLSPGALQLLLSGEQSHLISKAILKLSEKEASIITQIFFNEKSLREVSDELDVPLKNLKKIYKSALSKLRKELKALS